MLVESKSNLARLMATENLIVEQRQVSTAFFDIKNRVLTVPVLNGNLSNEVLDLLLGHEVGHALETPEQGWHDSVVDLKVNRSILNVCEDVRIEKKIKRKFPGIRISFVKGYRELMEMDFFGVKDTNLNTLNFIDRVNLYTKGGAAQRIDFSHEETQLLREVEDAETFDETVVVALKIQEFMKEQAKNPLQKSKTSEVEDGSDGGEAVESDAMDFDMENSEDSKNSGNEPKEGEAKTGDINNDLNGADSSNEGKDDKKETMGSSGTAGSDDAKVDSETDQHFRQKESELYSSDKRRDVIYSNIPDLNTKNIIVPFKTIIEKIEEHNRGPFLKEYFRQDVMRQNFSKFRAESNKVVSYLVKEFEMRKNAEQQTRAKISKTGELNLSKIHEYKFTDDIFARMTKVPNGKSHGLVMFIDWSGSMCDHMGPTVKQLLNLVMFCKKVNIPFEVYAFSTNILNDTKLKIQEMKAGDLYVHNFSLLNILSNKMSANDFVKMASYLLDYGSGRRGSCSNMEPPPIMELGGTPLNEAVMAAFNVIPEFQKQNKLQIVNTVFLTDGEGSSVYGRIENVNVDRFNSCDVTPNWKQRSFFRDAKTKASVEIGDKNHGYSSRASQQTIALLKLLKQRTEANVVGFYIAKSRDIQQAISNYTNAEDFEFVKSRIVDFRKNNFTYLNNIGYDEYYFLRSDKLDTDEDDEFEVSSTTTRGLVSAFSKYTNGRVSNRIVLNRFINLIT